MQIHILDSQPQCFHEPQATAIQHLGYEGFRSFEMAQNSAHLPHCEYHGEALAPSGSDHALQTSHITVQHLSVQKQQSANEPLFQGQGRQPLQVRLETAGALIGLLKT